MALNVSNGYVVYTRGKDSTWYWKGVHNKAIADAATLPKFYQEDFESKYTAASQRLKSLGSLERKNEIALIEQVTGTEVKDTEDIKSFIRKFNEVLMGKKQYEKALFRLKEALKEENQGKSARAPTIASFFTSKLGTALNQNISDFVDKNIEAFKNKDFSQWEKEFDSIIDKSIEQAFKEMLTKIKKQDGKEMYGDTSDWKEFYKVSQEIEGFNEDFKEMIKTKIDFSKILNIFEENKIKYTKGRRKGIRKIIDNKDGLNLRNEKKSRSIGGSVQEYIMQIAYNFGEAAKSAISGKGVVFKSEIMKADNVTLFEFESNTGFDAEQLVDILQENMLDTTSLQDAANKMEQYYNQYLSQLNNSFIVYGSTKSYSLSESFNRGGFGGGGNRKLSEIPTILDKAGIGSQAVIDKYIKIAYNTASGAIFENEREQVKEGLRAQLMGAIAELLFDDWYSFSDVEKGGAKSIHVLQLEGLQIPLSVFLTATGLAFEDTIKNMNRFARIHINPFKEITYKDKEDILKEAKAQKKEGEEIKNFVKEKWEEERKKAQNESVFSLSFLSNFKTIIKEWIE